MALYLNVPYEQKDLVKALGAKWDQIRKQWYVTDKFDYYKYFDWFPEVYEQCDLVCDYMYIVEAPRKCNKCKNDTSVVGLAFQNFFSIKKDENGNLIGYRYNNKYLNFFTLDDETDNTQLEFFLKKHFRYYYSYSKTMRDSYIANHCEHCGAIQGNHYLYEEPSGPFFDIDNADDEVKKRINLYKITFTEDGVTCPDYTGDGFMPSQNMQVKIIDNLNMKPGDIYKVYNF